MRKFDDVRIARFDDGKQTGARRKHRLSRVLRAPFHLKNRGGLHAEIKRKKVCEFFDTKWADSYCDALVNVVSIFPILLIDLSQHQQTGKILVRQCGKFRAGTGSPPPIQLLCLVAFFIQASITNFCLMLVHF